MALTTLNAGVEIVLLVAAEEPAEIAVRRGEILEPRHYPTSKLVDVVALRNGRNLRGVGTEVAVGRGLATSERIAVEEAHVAVGLDIIAEHLADLCANLYAGISRLFHLAAGNGDGTGHVDITGVEQMAEEDDGCGVDGPHHFALVDGVDIVNLNPDVARRTRTVEDVDVDVAGVQ